MGRDAARLDAERCRKVCLKILLDFSEHSGYYENRAVLEWCRHKRIWNNGQDSPSRCQVYALGLACHAGFDSLPAHF